VRGQLRILAFLGCLIVAACSTSGPGDLSRKTYVRSDAGGQVIDYAIRTAKLRESGKPVHISGKCASACTMYLALSPSQICIAPGTSFLFHAPYGASVHGRKVARQYFLANYPDWVRSWLARRGGLSGKLLVMDYAYASRHLRTCTLRV
jgi:hypothetical protein